MTTGRLHMRLSWTAAPLPPGRPAPGGVTVRGLSQADGAALGWLMWSAFHGTADDEWPTPRDAASDAMETLAGTWGPVLWAASLAAEIGSQLVAATVVVRDDKHEYVPLLAFGMTDPAYQGRGIGRRLIEETIGCVAASGLDELHLAVVRGNPAVELYKRLGFQVVPETP